MKIILIGTVVNIILSFAIGYYWGRSRCSQMWVSEIKRRTHLIQNQLAVSKLIRKELSCKIEELERNQCAT